MFLRSISLGFFTIALLTASSAYPAELKPETLAAWSNYLRQQTLDVQKRANQRASFLWIDSSPKRRSQIRSGAILTVPADGQTPQRIAGGLIHHWIAATFIPHVRIEDVTAIMRDYTRYKDYYRPGVEASTIITSMDNKDEFDILLANRSVLSKTSLQGNYVCEYTRVSDKRWYDVCLTRQLQEIKDFGKPDEMRLAPDHGTGYIWRLYSTSRLEECDGGVILEVEAVALSRDVPGSLHWLVSPIIRRISQESLQKTMSETVAAVQFHSEAITLNSR